MLAMKTVAAVFFVMTAVVFPLKAENIELVNLPTPLDEIPQPFPMDMSNVVLKSNIQAAPIEGQPAIEPVMLTNLIDTDRTTCANLDKKGEYRFLITMGTISRVSAITLTGNLQGATATIQVAELPLKPGEEGWTTVFSGKVLGTPATASAFRPTSTFRALVTINTTGAQDARPTLSDIAFYATPDHREYNLVPNPNKKTQDKDKNEGNQEKFLVNKTVTQDEFDLANMYAGAKVSHVSSIAHPDQAHNINDGNAETVCEFDPKEKDSVAVIDLGQSRRVRKISMVHSLKPGDMSLYVTDRLPWEQEAKATKVAWNAPLAFEVPTLSDVPFLAQLGVGPPAVKSTAPIIIQVQSAWFDQMQRFGGANSESDHFTQIAGPLTNGRYVIIRFLNHSPSSLDGFQINDINVFGDYEKDDFILVPKDFGEPQQEALIINTTPSPPVTPRDYIKDPTPAPTPAPVSP